jgi:hypothetical protein
VRPESIQPAAETRYIVQTSGAVVAPTPR